MPKSEFGILPIPNNFKRPLFLLLLFLLAHIACANPSMSQPCDGEAQVPLNLDLNGDGRADGPKWHCVSNPTVEAALTSTAQAPPSSFPTQTPISTPTFPVETAPTETLQAQTTAVPEISNTPTLETEDPRYEELRKLQIKMLDLVSKHTGMMIAVGTPNDEITPEMIDDILNTLFNPINTDFLEQYTIYPPESMPGLATSITLDSYDIYDDEPEHILSITEAIVTVFENGIGSNLSNLVVTQTGVERDGWQADGTYQPFRGSGGSINFYTYLNENEKIVDGKMTLDHLELQIHEVIHAFIGFSDLSNPIITDFYGEILRDSQVDIDNLLNMLILYNGMALTTPNISNIEANNIYNFPDDYCSDTDNCAENIVNRAIWGHVPEEYFTSVTTLVIVNDLLDQGISNVEYTRDDQDSISNSLNQIPNMHKEMAKLNSIAGMAGHHSLQYIYDANSNSGQIWYENAIIADYSIGEDGLVYSLSLTPNGQSLYWWKIIQPLIDSIGGLNLN